MNSEEADLRSVQGGRDEGVDGEVEDKDEESKETKN
jgi:hypothetical protein